MSHKHSHFTPPQQKINEIWFVNALIVTWTLDHFRNILLQFTKSEQFKYMEVNQILYCNKQLYLSQNDKIYLLDECFISILVNYRNQVQIKMNLTAHRCMDSL